MTRTPKSLIIRLRNAGDQEAWDRFVTLFMPILVKWSNSFGRDAEDAEELVQEVFLTLFEHFATSSYDHEKPFRGWLWGMMKHKASQRKKSAFAGKRQQRAMDQLADRSMPEPDFGTYERDLVKGALAAIQSQVEPATFRAFQLCKLEGKPARDVARELKKTEYMVYQSVSRVMKRLRTELDGLADL